MSFGFSVLIVCLAVYIAVYNVTPKQLRCLLGYRTDGSSKICRDIGDFNEINLQNTQSFYTMRFNIDEHVMEDNYEYVPF